MKILVIGGKGYVGSYYIKALEKAGITPPRDIDIYDLPRSILNEEILEHEISNHDLIIHFAAVADLYESAKDMDNNFNVNVRGTYNVAKYCQKYNRFLVYISTCCVYGNSTDYLLSGGVNEYSNLNTNELYASTKLAGENIIKGIPDLNWCIWRIGTNYGVGMRESLMTYIALDHVNHEKEIYIHGTGTQTRNFIFIDDLCDAMVAISKDIIQKNFDSFSNKEIFNICSSEQISVWDCIEIAEKIYKKKAQTRMIEDRIGQIARERISCAKMEHFFNWKAKTSFYDGMKYCAENDARLGAI